jgi:hypothetical protein
MANIINGTDTGSGGLITTGDSSDELQIQTAETTAITVDSGQRTKFPTTIGVGGATPSTSGSGISFPATQSASSDANTLDDYEEGTWTPTLSAGFSTAPTSYSQQSGSYTKIGRFVFATMVLDPNGAVGQGSIIKFGGLPFLSNASITSCGAFVTYQASFNTNTGDTYLIPAGETEIQVYTNTGTDRVGNAAGVDINNQIRLAVVYQV